MEAKFEPRFHQWTRLKLIGKGSVGTVSLVVDDRRRIFAVKSVNVRSPVASSLESEIQILRSLSSPFVVDYLGDDTRVESPTTSYRNLHMEYAPLGTVADVAGHVDEALVRSYTWCVLSALEYVHSQGIIHCDVKCRNVLVGPTAGTAKLADFGSAKMEGDSDSQSLSFIPRGTPLWMAPEVVRRERQGPESDVWSLGCTVIEMITGRPAWDCSDDQTMFRIAFSDELPEFPSELSALGRDFLDKCLRRQWKERWSCDQLLQHPFVSSAKSAAEPSPRSMFDRTAWEACEEALSSDCDSQNSNVDSLVGSAKGRMRKLGCRRGVTWEPEGWEVVRVAEISSSS